MNRFLKLGKNLIKLYLLGQRVPLFVLFLLTNRCNSLCKYCRMPLRDKKELSTERVLSLIDEMAEAGTYRLGLFGGEPLLREDIYAITSHAKKKGLLVHLYTNGIMIKQNIDTIKLLDGVFISLDGPEHINDEFRGKGAFKKAIEAIEICRKFTPVFLMTVITKQNKDYISYISDLSREYNCLVNYQVVAEKPSFSADIGQYKLDEKEEKECVREILELKKCNPNIALSKINLKRMLKRKPSLPKKGYMGKGIVRCWNGRAACSIDANGNLYSCFQLIDKEDVLNINHNSFKDAFNHIQSCTCLGCDVTCSAEYNFWLSLHPEAIFNLIALIAKSSGKQAISR